MNSIYRKTANLLHSCNVQNYANLFNLDNEFCVNGQIRWATNFQPYKLFYMLEYVKTVLTKVSFDAKLFEKELKKAIKSLLQDEITELRTWCYDQFSETHQPVLQRCFVTL